MTKRGLSLAEFDTFPDNIKIDILHQDGLYVGKRSVDKQTVILFQLHSFYVEIYRKQISRILTSGNLEIVDS